MNETSSPLQVNSGRMLGLLLQPVSLWIVANYFSGKPLKEWKLAIFAFYAMYASILPIPRGVFAIPSFGVAQAFTILPAVLLMWLAGRHGVVRGLLQTGTLLALANLGVMVFVYVRFYSTIA